MSRTNRKTLPHRRKSIAIRYVGLLGSMAFVMSGTTWAEEATGAPDEAHQASDALTEIVVTALKRSTNLESTPLSMSAETGDALARAGVTDVHNLLQTTPSLSFVDAGPSQTRVMLRGIYSPGEPTIGLYYDEAPVSGAVGSSSDAGASLPLVRLFDVERVESLRGPQGTLYGSGSMGGTLRVIFNKPSLNTTEGAIDADGFTQHGGAPGYDAQAMVNVPVIDDKLALRAVVYTQHDGGYVDNVFLGQNNFNTADTQGARVLARFKPTQDITIDGSVMYQHSYGQDPKWTAGGGDYDSVAQIQLPYSDRLTLYNLTVRWDLGPLTLTAIGSDMDRNVTSFAQDTSYFFAKDLNNPAACQVFAGGGMPCSPAQQDGFNEHVQQSVPSGLIDYQKVNSPSAELRLSSATNGFLDWTVGGFFSNRITHANIPILGANPVTGALNSADVIYERQIYDQLRQVAAFGEGAAHLTRKLTLTFGTRYFHYERTTGGSIPVGFDLVGAKVTPYATTGGSENGWVTKTNLSYQATDNLLFYGSASQGFRPGGVNQVLGLPVSLTAYQPDTLWDYEGGVKVSWLDKRLVLDLDGYWINWSDMQVLGHGTGTASNFQFITNAGEARVKGIEGSLSVRPVNGLTLQANGTVSSAELTEDQVNSQVTGAGKKGNRIPYIPKVTGGVSAEYDHPLTSALSGMVRVDENYVGGSYSEFNNNATFMRSLPAYSLTNARIGIEGEDDKWGVFLYVNNIFDRLAVTYAFTQALSGGQTLLTSAPPRTVGVNVRTKF